MPEALADLGATGACAWLPTARPCITLAMPGNASAGTGAGTLAVPGNASGRFWLKLIYRFANIAMAVSKMSD